MTVAENGTTLTRREQQIAQLARRGLSYSEIARELGTTKTAVSSHLVHMRERFECHTTPALVAYLEARGLLEGRRDAAKQ